MELTENARETFEVLFPNSTSTLAITDPELIQVFSNFAFGDVPKHSELDARTRIMVQLAALIACDAGQEFRVMLDAAMAVGASPGAIKEVVYQAVPYVGMGRTVHFLHMTNDFLVSRGVSLPLAPQATTGIDDRFNKGLNLQKFIVGESVIEAMYANAPEDLEHIQCFLSANCFGDYVSRGLLDINTRELLTFSMLASMGGCEPQVGGHVMANLHVGNSRGVLIDVVTQILPFIGYPRALNAIRVIEEKAPIK